jgi:integration host factor subunit beta
MVKRELIAELARRHKELKVKDVDLMARLVFDAITEALAQGREVELRGFGSFRLRRYEPRQARNPGTGEIVELPERMGVRFKVGRDLDQKLRSL